MSNYFRILSSSVFVSLAIASFGAQAKTDNPLSEPSQSATGNFLAGQQALRDLSTGDAASFFRTAVQADWNNPMLAERAFIAQAANGDIDQAAKAAKRLLELDPKNELARLVVGTVALKDRRYDAAIAELAPLGTDNFTGITGAVLRAFAYTGGNKATEGSKSLDVVSKNGLEDFLVFYRALMAEISGDQTKALDFAKKAYDADPGVAPIVNAYARMLGNAGRFDEAIDVVVRYEAQGANSPLLTQVKADLASHRKPGPYSATVQQGASEMFHGIAVSLARDGSNDTAIVFLRLARYLDPSSDVVTLVIGQLLDQAGQHESADALYSGISTKSPLRSTAVLRVALNLDAKGDRKQALRQLGNIVTAEPQNLDAISELGNLQRFDGQYDAAAESYSKALAVSGGDRPADWAFYYQRGIAYERGKHWDKAEPDFLKALQLNPDQPQVLNYLGYTWVDQGAHLDEALQMIQKAVKATPRDGLMVDSLGWAYYKLGRIDDAVATLEQAVQMQPNDPEINDHLGDAYWKSGRKLEARFQWNIATSVDKEGAVKARVASKLANGLDNTTGAAGTSTAGTPTSGTTTQ